MTPREQAIRDARIALAAGDAERARRLLEAAKRFAAQKRREAA